jgi:hypothetical protein
VNNANEKDPEGSKCVLSRYNPVSAHITCVKPQNTIQDSQYLGEDLILTPSE